MTPQNFWVDVLVIRTIQKKLLFMAGVRKMCKQQSNLQIWFVWKFIVGDITRWWEDSLESVGHFFVTRATSEMRV